MTLTVGEPICYNQRMLTDAEVKLCVDALWDNLFDGHIADLRYGSNFDAAARELEKTFRAFILAQSRRSSRDR